MIGLQEPTKLSEYDIKWKQDLRVLRAEFQNAVLPALHKAERQLYEQHKAIRDNRERPRRLASSFDDIQQLVYKATQAMLPPADA